MCVCVHKGACVCTCTCVRLLVCAYAHTRTCVCMHENIAAYVHVHTCVVRGAHACLGVVMAYFCIVLLPKVPVQLAKKLHLGNPNPGGLMQNLCRYVRRCRSETSVPPGARGATWTRRLQSEDAISTSEVSCRADAEVGRPPPPGACLSARPAALHPLQTSQKNRFDYQTNFILCSNEELLLCKCG